MSASSSPRRLTRLPLVALAVGLVLAVLVLSGARGLAALRERPADGKGPPAGGRFVNAGDVRLFVQEAGPPSARVVLFVHGTGAWSEIWRPAMIGLAGAGFHSVAVDMPPFGFSDRPASGDYGPEAQARRIARLIDALGAQQVALVAHSYGARAALLAAEADTVRIGRLVLVDPALGLDAQASGGPSLATRAALGVGPLRGALAAATITNPAMTRRLTGKLVAHPERLTSDQIAVLQYPMRRPGTTDAVSAWLPDFALAPEPPVGPRREAFTRLSTPVHLVWGRLDTVTPLAQGEDLARIARCATLDVLEDVGHIPALEAPAPLTGAILDRLGGPPRCGAGVLKKAGATKPAS